MATIDEGSVESRFAFLEQAMLDVPLLGAFVEDDIVVVVTAHLPPM